MTEVDPDERSPGGDGNGDEAVVLAAEVGNAVEFRRTAEPAGQIVGPTVVAATKARG